MLVHRETKKKITPLLAQFEADELRCILQIWLPHCGNLESILRSNITEILHSSWVNANLENVGYFYTEKPAQKEIKPISSEIEKPLLFLYKSIFEMIDGLFYNIEYVRDRKQKYILNLLIIIPYRNIEEEKKIYKQIGHLMREYSDFLIDFSLIRRKDADIKDLSKGYTGYVYP